MIDRKIIGIAINIVVSLVDRVAKVAGHPNSTRPN